MDLSERKLRILQAIISDFVTSAEPVGSRTLSKKYDLGVSPATIRNEMADLEEQGFLTHPHTSAGRIPSEKAYRLYVNEMMKTRELSQKEKDVISKKLYDNVTELDKTIEHAAHILSEITNLTSFALTPEVSRDTLKFIELLPVDEDTVVLMIVSDSGKVSNTTLKLRVPYDEESLRLLSKNLTYNYKGKSLSEALTLDIIEDFETDIEAMSALARNVMPSFMKTLGDMLNVNLYMDGLTNIFSLPEYNDLDKAKSFMEMVNRREDLTRTLINRDKGVMITIGTENAEEIMDDCSLITATYHVDGKLIGKLGVIGPTRMRYGEVTSVIEYLTDNISNTFRMMEGDDDDDEG
ncbi:MAG: heat-inducible transcription repressor HrcA [Firmicutes bacterium]|nr:heat-inducible transcription repressor HrcA [Bacillota bacterium]MBQ2678099.1 heat-inducible transcription repressor HrcA [Bacillota bacterium]MBR2511539.1 heat-inducible transcription repressor HrcA [Bacillota bacterium]MDO4860331.1 heat-inducible transcriptional repressor HrcA [Bacillota bacterium]